MMAETLVPFMVENIITQLKNEAILLAGVSKDFNEIKDELDSMKAFLKEAEKRRITDDGVKLWVEQVRDATYDIEDIIDKFMYYLGRRRGASDGMFGLVRKTVHLHTNLWYKHKMGYKLQDTKLRIKAISERRIQYSFNNNEEGHSNLQAPSSWLQHRRESATFVEDDDIIGIQQERKLLLEWLMEDQKQRTVVSVYGMGGSGKTTLIANVYNGQALKREFDCTAWITVSQTYVLEDLFRSMLKQFSDSKRGKLPRNLSSMSNTQLVETLRGYLQEKRYIVVLDDVWSINAWEEISMALLKNENGSRVVLTTRHENVARFSSGTPKYVHHLQPLNDSDAWLLFSKKAFSTDPNTTSTCCPPELEQVALSIVQKCKGLPLALVALGGLMSCKNKMTLEWLKVYHSINWELSNNRTLEVVKSILLLSYNDLPYHLKHCFLYCCLFPEDYSVQRKRLIRLWIAEGFIEERKGMSLEEVAETYLTELVQRSMLQVVERNHFWRPKAFRMHDILREIALSISEREKFGTIFDNRERSKDSRRLSIVHGGDDSMVDNIHHHVDLSNLRSVFLFNLNKILPSTSKGLLPSFFLFYLDRIIPSPTKGLLPSGFKLLRVLDLQGVSLTSVPDDIVDLFNLRYLNLRDTQIAELPRSLGKLRNLEILDIVNTKVETLPRGIVKLKRLRHLLMYRLNFESSQSFNFVNGAKVPSEICKLRNLQFLTNIEASDEIVKQIGNMNQLRTFGIRKVRGTQGTQLCKSIQRMDRLSSLFVMASDEEELLELDDLWPPPPVLHKLFLVGKMQKVPPWFHSLHNLTFLYLHCTQLEEDPLPHIHALPFLGRLNLINAYDGENMWFQTGSFPKLNKLYLGNFQKLNQMTIDKGAIPNIQQLYISTCGKLKMVPEGIEHLSKLKTLSFEGVTEELVQRLRGEESVDRPRVRHIPEIDLYYWKSSEWVYESLSSSSSSSSSANKN